jgi:predicted glycosyltransferase
MNDNEHALGNIPSFLFATKILVPEFLSSGKLGKYFASKDKINYYPGVKEGIYLWEMKSLLDPCSAHRSSKLKPKVYIRPEPWTAQYYKGKVNFLDDLIIDIKDEFDIIILPRGGDQGAHYKDKKFLGIQVLEEVLDLETIVPDCDLFIGAGGTMTREMAVLGVPTISVYQDELLEVDKHLIRVGAFIHAPKLSASELKMYLLASARGVIDRELLIKGRQAYTMIKHAILTT